MGGERSADRQGYFSLDRLAEYRDAWEANITPGNPRRAEQLQVVLSLIPFTPQQSWRGLDMGCGGAAVAQLLLDAFPRARIVGFDVEPGWIKAGRQRLRPYVDRAHLFLGDFADDAWRRDCGGDFDVALAIQSWHHVAAERKEQLCVAAHEVLTPGGLLILADKIRLPTVQFFPQHWRVKQLLKDGRPRLGALPQEDHATYYESAAAAGDYPASLVDHKRWLTAAGFITVNCFWRMADRVILGALKGHPAARSERSAATRTA